MRDINNSITYLMLITFLSIPKFRKADFEERRIYIATKAKRALNPVTTRPKAEAEIWPALLRKIGSRSVVLGRRRYKIESLRGMVIRYTLVQAEGLPFVMRVVTVVHIAVVGTANVVQARRYCPSQSLSFLYVTRGRRGAGSCTCDCGNMKELKAHIVHPDGVVRILSWPIIVVPISDAAEVGQVGQGGCGGAIAGFLQISKIPPRLFSAISQLSNVTALLDRDTPRAGQIHPAVIISFSFHFRLGTVYLSIRPTLFALTKCLARTNTIFFSKVEIARSRGGQIQR